MRAWSCANSEAIASSVLISSWLPLPATEFDEAEHAGGHPPETSGAAATEGDATCGAFPRSGVGEPVSIVCRGRRPIHNWFRG